VLAAQLRDRAAGSGFGLFKEAMIWLSVKRGVVM
jgi:hypothetical protein